MVNFEQYEVWFVTGSQHLYGPETLDQVNANSREIAAALDASPDVPVKIVFKPVVKTSEEILSLVLEANSNAGVIGLITWMHTFSPAKMWIRGLTHLQKPFLHLHTQHHREIPWAEIDMDFMNLNQAAHGDREYGFIGSRLRLERKVVVGHWTKPSVHAAVGAWTRAASARREWETLSVARFGDNMRDVAVTEGDKVQAEIKLGYRVSGYGVGDLVKVVGEVTDDEIDKLIQEYLDTYEIQDVLRPGGSRADSLREGARIELGLRHFLTDGGFNAFTTNFEDLHGLTQLPGMAVQRLMNDGYGFGAEGDWKTSALVRAMKVMAHGLTGGVSFMEDYTYHLADDGDLVLGAHMLEVCSSIAQPGTKPRVEILPLGIGNKADPVRLIFDSQTGPAVAASIMHMGNRFRLLSSSLEVVPMEHDLPKLPTARALWKPLPDLQTNAAAWIYAGGAHHTSFSLALTPEHLRDFADMNGMEFVAIDERTRIEEFRDRLRWNDLYHHLSGALR